MRLCQMYNGLISYICSMYEKNPEEETFKTFFLKYHDVLVLYATSILKMLMRQRMLCWVVSYRLGKALFIKNFLMGWINTCFMWSRMLL